MDASGIPETVVDTSQDELAVLNSEHTVEIAGRKITIREPNFIDGLNIRNKAHAFIKDVATAGKHDDLLTDDILDILARHSVKVKELLCDCCEGVDQEWMASLKDENDGERLLLEWWSVCAPFFWRQITRRWVESAKLELDRKKVKEEKSGGQISSSPSPQPESENQKNSEETTPSDS